MTATPKTETERLLTEILEILERDSPSHKMDRTFESIDRAEREAPKTFQKCGHPFPKVSVLGGENLLYEQIYTCKTCGVKEGYP